METLQKYIENIESNPTEEKYRRIRQSNKAYQERVKDVEGAVQFMEGAGFVEQQLPHNDTMDTFWVIIKNSTLMILRFTVAPCI